MTGAELLAEPLEQLTAAAAQARDVATGTRITFSPKVFIPLTRLCRDLCGYCTFAQPPARVEAPYLTSEEVLAISRDGADAGCHEALFTLGEQPEDRYPVARDWLDAAGYGSTVDYLVAVAGLVLAETGLLPHSNAGALTAAELARLRAVSGSQGMMLESLNPDLACHRGAPDKTPERRLATLDAAGELGIPFTTGLLVGIGESRADRVATLEAIAASHRRHGHVQEVIVQNFLPKAGTAMRAAPPCPPDELLWTIAVARLVLPSEIHLQAPPNLSDDLGALLAAGIDDWGGVSPVTPDHVNPERPWPSVVVLRAATEAAGFELAPRLTIYPEFALDPVRWLDRAVRPAVLAAADAEGLGRDLDHWFAGGQAPPPRLLPDTPRAGGRVGEVLAGPWPASRWARTRSSPCSRLAAGRWRRWRRWPTTCAGARWAMSSRGWPTATSTTPMSARSSAGSAPSPRVPSRSTCGATPTCSRSTRCSGGWWRRSSWAPPRSACRGASTPASTASTTSTCARR